jgi:hypothetical protein
MAKDANQSGSSHDNQGGGGEQTIPYPRFQEVNSKLKDAEEQLKELAAFKELGFSAPELGEILQVTDAMAAHIKKQQDETAANDAKAKAIPAGAGTEEEQETEKLRTSIYRAIPALKELEQLPELRKTEAKEKEADTLRQRQVRGERAIERLKTVAKKAGYADEHLPYLEAMMTGLVNKDPKLVARFNDGDVGVVDEVFDYYKGTLVGPASRSKSAGAKRVKDVNQQELSPNLKGGSAKSPEGEKAPKTIDDADKQAMEFLEENVSDLPETDEEE